MLTDMQRLPVRPVVRVQQSLLAKPERRLLNWLCARLPRSITPDKLTALGFAGTVMLVAGYGLSGMNRNWLILTVIGYGINWFGDSLDGSLARYRKIERPEFGYFVDHSLDAFGNLLTLIGIGLTPWVRMDVALFAAGAYLLLSIHTFLAARVTGTFRLSYGLLGPTELRFVLIGMAGAMYGSSSAKPSQWSGFDSFVGAAAFVMLALFIKQTIALARELAKLPTRSA